MNRVTRPWIPLLGTVLPYLGMSDSTYAIDAPCALVEVSHPAIKITARVTDGATIRPVTFEDSGVKHRGSISVTLDKKHPAYSLSAPPIGWRYEEIRVQTRNETIPPIRGVKCLNIRWVRK